MPTPALSPRRAFWVADGLSTIPMVTVRFPQADGVKRMAIPCVGVRPFPLIHRFASRRRSFLLIMHRTCIYSTISNCEGCVGFIVEKGPFLSNIAGVFGLWNDLLFHRDP